MVPAALRRLGTLGLIALWVLVSGGLLLLLALSVQNSVQFSQLQSWILLANVIALLVVGWLLTRKILELVRNFRAQVPGSRLTARTVAIFGSLVIAPLIIVYLFSLEFLNRGIDSWFKVEIRQGLTDALELSKSAVDVRMREYARSTQLFANRLADSPPANWNLATDQQRVESGALEVVVYGKLGQVISASSAGASATLPRASSEITAAMDAGNVYWSLEPLSEDDYLINTAAPISSAPGCQPRTFRGGAVSRAATSRAFVRSRAAFLFAAQQPHLATRGSEESLRHDAHAGAAAGHAHRDLWRHLLGGETGPTGAGPDRRHARRGQG